MLKSLMLFVKIAHRPEDVRKLWACQIQGLFLCLSRKKEMWNQRCASEIIEETKHIPTVPCAKRNPQTLGDLQCRSSLWAGLGQPMNSLRLDSTLLTLLSALLLYDYYVLCVGYSCHFLHDKFSPNLSVPALMSQSWSLGQQLYRI